MAPLYLDLTRYAVQHSAGQFLSHQTGFYYQRSYIIIRQRGSVVMRCRPGRVGSPGAGVRYESAGVSAFIRLRSGICCFGAHNGMTSCLLAFWFRDAYEGPVLSHLNSPFTALTFLHETNSRSSVQNLWIDMDNLNMNRAWFSLLFFCQILLVLLE
jgi:hypothetical protein